MELAHAFFPHYGGDVHMNEGANTAFTAGPFTLEVTFPHTTKLL